MSLREDRCKFTLLLSHLIQEMDRNGYHPAIGRDGLKHKEKSLHYDGLAVDIDLYDAEGRYLTRTEDHLQFGEYWENLDPKCTWGGRWSDGNHYSLGE